MLQQVSKLFDQRRSHFFVLNVDVVETRTDHAKINVQSMRKTQIKWRKNLHIVQLTILQIFVNVITK